MKHLSILGKDYHTQEDVVGYYNTGDRMKSWGKLGAFWGGLWGFMIGSAFFIIPGVGPLIVAGPMVTWIIGALEGAAVMGGMSALGAGLFSMGIPKDSIVKYETAIKADKFILEDINGLTLFINCDFLAVIVTIRPFASREYLKRSNTDNIL